MRGIWTTLGVFLFLGVIGCGEGTPVPVHPTSGRLLINGQPAPDAIVGLHPVSGDFDETGSRPAGKVQADGTFVMATYGKEDGVPVGEYIVTVFWPSNPEGPDTGADRLYNKYSSAAKSSLRITIKEGENELAPIELKDVRVMKPGKRS